MVLKQICFTDIAKQGYIGLAIIQSGKCLVEGGFKEVLDSIPHLANCEVKEQRPYFNEWVVEIN